MGKKAVIVNRAMETNLKCPCFTWRSPVAVSLQEKHSKNSNEYPRNQRVATQSSPASGDLSPAKSSQEPGAGALQVPLPQALSQLDTQAGDFQKELQVCTCPHPAVVTETEPASVKAPHSYRQVPECLHETPQALLCMIQDASGSHGFHCSPIPRARPQGPTPLCSTQGMRARGSGFGVSGTFMERPEGSRPKQGDALPFPRAFMRVPATREHLREANTCRHREAAVNLPEPHASV